MPRLDRSARTLPLLVATVLPFASACAQADHGPVVATTSAAPSISIAGAPERNPVADATVIVECVQGNVVREPATLTVSCADSNSVLESLRWSGWGDDTASATGTLVNNLCEPSCAQGRLERYPVSIEVQRLEHLEAGQAYSELVVTFIDDHPPGSSQSETYPLTTPPA